jgi:hypothetical protein
MQRWYAAGHFQPGLDLGQGQIRLRGDQGPEPRAILGQDLGFAPGETMPVGDVAGSAALLE